MLPANLESEFDLACRNRTQEHRQHLADAGITFQAMLRAGDLGVERISAEASMVDQACGCEADSGDPDYSCDCAMQGHCICSQDCKCKTDVCQEAVKAL